jgi:hypothetical protein
MVEDNQDVLWTLYIIFIFVVFILGFLLGALFSPNRREEYEPWHARLAAAEGEPRHDGKKIIIGLLAVSTALSLLVLAGTYLARALVHF